MATLSLKNMALGASLHNSRSESRWNDKRLFHGGVRQTHVDIALTAQKLQPYWGDGPGRLGGNGRQRTDCRNRRTFSDCRRLHRLRGRRSRRREVMGINPDWIGYLNFCAQWDSARMT